MKVGMAETPLLAAVSGQLSTSTFKKTARGYLLANSSKNGAILWQGPHLLKVMMIIYDYITYTISNNDDSNDSQ
jgi:hypothetical protein